MAWPLQVIRRDLRRLRRGGFVSVFVVASLVLGIGGNAASFSLLSAWLLKPIPYPEPERLVLLGERQAGTPDVVINTLFSSLPTWADFRERSRTLEAFAAFGAGHMSLSLGDRSVPVTAGTVTAGFFGTVGAEPFRGRFFGEAEAVEGGPPMAVVTRSLWEERLGREGDPLGEVLVLDGVAREIVGVVEEDVGFLVPDVGVWLPLQRDPAAAPRDERFYFALARIAPGATMEQVEAEVAALAARLALEHPETNRGWTVDAVNLRTEFPDAFTRLYLALMQGAMLFVLLIACANITSLLLARHQERRKEIALRTALGAGRFRIVGQLLRESAILAVLGGAGGVALASVAIRTMSARTAHILGAWGRPAVDGPVLLYALALTVLCGLLFGALPAAQSLRRDQVEVLKQAGPGSSGGSRGAVRAIRLLVVAEVALCLVALGAGSVLVRSFQEVRGRDAGYRAAGLLTVRFEVPAWKYRSGEERVALMERVRAGAAGLEGARRATLVSGLPESLVTRTDTFRVDGEPALHGESVPTAVFLRASPEYLETVEAPLLQGRFLESGDDADAAPVVVVSRALAERRFPGESPLGRRVTVRGSSREIVGVAGDVHQTLLGKTLGSFDETVYVPLAQAPAQEAYLVVRTAGAPRALADPVRETLRLLDPDVTVNGVETMEEYAGRYLVGIDFFNVLLACFGVFALLLASLGTYGVVAYGVGRRTREIGVRAALGALPRQVVSLFALEGLAMSAAGLALGVLALVPVVRVASHLLEGFALPPVRPLMLIGVGALLFTVTLVASVVPARRAARVDPAAALRE